MKVEDGGVLKSEKSRLCCGSLVRGESIRVSHSKTNVTCRIVTFSYMCLYSLNNRGYRFTGI